MQTKSLPFHVKYLSLTASESSTQESLQIMKGDFLDQGMSPPQNDLVFAVPLQISASAIIVVVCNILLFLIKDMLC